MYIRFYFLLGAEPLTENVRSIEMPLVLKELLRRWKSLGDSTEDRTGADCEFRKDTFAFLVQVRHCP